MSKMLLSIKPEYVKKILSGKKKYEFRKFHCHDDVDTIVIYCTSPVKKLSRKPNSSILLKEPAPMSGKRRKDSAAFQKSL